jgi:hypothetical protein
MAGSNHGTARVVQVRGGEPRSAVPALDDWLASFREREREPKVPICAPIDRIRRWAVNSFARWARLGSNQHRLACKNWQHHSPALFDLGRRLGAAR